jgi:Stage II sporulation protein E (SpoIIE)/NACHT domain
MLLLNPTAVSERIEILRVIVASPSDVAAERDIVSRVLEDLNRSVAADRGVRLEPIRWETDAYPSFHPEGPQGAIDSVLRIPDAALLIGIFWKRFGTPTKDAASGTEHEIRLAYEAWKQNRRPQIMVYFNQKPWTPQTSEELAQFGRLLDFRAAFPEEALWWSYKGATQFEQQLRTHLINFIRATIPLGAVQPAQSSNPTPAADGPGDYFSIQKTLVDEYARVFVERPQAQRALDTFLTTEPRGYFILTGHPGSGKTAFVSHLVRTRGYLHHFINIAGGRAEPHLILRSLLSQIIPRTRPGTAIPDNIPQMTKLWEELLAIAAQTTPTMVVIDGLDELPSQANQRTPYLVTDGLPRGAYIILTVRRGEPLESVEALVAMLPHRVYELEPLAQPEIEEILRLRGLKLAPQVSAYIAEASQGNPLYVRAVADQIQSNPQFRVGDLPSTVEGFYRTITAKLRMSADDNLRNVLGLLAVARKPLTLRELQEITSTGQRTVYEKGIAPIRDFLIEGNEGYWFFHASFRDFVLAKLLYADELRQFHSKIVYYLRRSEAVHSEYGLTSLAYHLSEAGDRAGLIDIISPSFLAAKARRFGFAVLEDIDLVSRAMLQNGDPACVEDCVKLVEELRGVAGDELIHQATLAIKGNTVTPRLPAIPGIDAYLAIMPSRDVTADFYEYFADRDSLVMAIGDAPSTGLKSSFVARFLGNLLKTVVEKKEATDLARALEGINEAIAPFEYFERVSMQCIRLDVAGGLMHIANAGHPDPVLYSERYHRCDILPIPGEVLHDPARDVRRLNTYDQFSAEIGPGDVLVLFTDGLLEGHLLAGDPYGYRFTAIIEANAQLSAREIGDAILQDFRRHTAKAEYIDDVMILVVAVRQN